MEVILLEKVQNLGELGDQVKVKPGFARNFLLPQGVAVPATDAYRAQFEAKRAELEKAANDKFAEAQQRAKSLKDLTVTIHANAADEGKLYGSVGTREICDAVAQEGHNLEKSEVELPMGPIYHTGEYDVHCHLHTDVAFNIHVKVVAIQE